MPAIEYVIPCNILIHRSLKSVDEVDGVDDGGGCRA